MNRVGNGAGTWESVSGRGMSREKLVVRRTDNNLIQSIMLGEMERGLLKNEPGWLSMDQILKSFEFTARGFRLWLESSMEIRFQWGKTGGREIFPGVQVSEDGVVNWGR